MKLDVVDITTLKGGNFPKAKLFFFLNFDIQSFKKINRLHLTNRTKWNN